MFDRAKHKVKSAARAAAFTATAMALFAVAAAFLTVAAWAVLALFYPTEIVALIIGAVYLGFGLISLAIAKMASAPSLEDHLRAEAQAAAPPAQDLQNAVVQSFLVGLSAGQGAATRR